MEYTEIFGAGCFNVEFSAIGLFIRVAFGSGVDDRAGVPIKRAAVPVAVYEVLLDFRSDRFKKIPQVPDQRIATQHGMLSLSQVPHGESGCSSRSTEGGEQCCSTTSGHGKRPFSRYADAFTLETPTQRAQRLEHAFPASVSHTQMISSWTKRIRSRSASNGQGYPPS